MRPVGQGEHRDHRVPAGQNTTSSGYCQHHKDALDGSFKMHAGLHMPRTFLTQAGRVHINAIWATAILPLKQARHGLRPEVEMSGS